ncbi:tyrosine-type recombinase/integrase, partial [Staphylococcus felis]|uniref:tyrosine-type recombinase/integrase n=1 Tax=Staphylococcus felis TaxID=46127 RepID=UPI000E36BCE7
GQTKKLIIEMIGETKDFNSEYLFVSLTGGVFSSESFRKNLNDYCEKFKINTHITPHMFRHTASMLFLENGGSVRVLQKILGHKKLATTEIYAHVTEDTIQEQQNTYSPLKQIMNSKKYNKPRNKRRK